MIHVCSLAALPDTVRLGAEKQAFATAGLLVTVNATVPAYPSDGVTVTVALPVLPAATVVLPTAIENDFAATLPTVKLIDPLDAA